MRARHERRLLALLCVLVTLASACSLMQLKRDVSRIHELAVLRGVASHGAGLEAPVIVVLTTADSERVVDTYVLTRPGSFFFVVPAGTYRLGAFVDRNGNATYDADSEPSTRLSKPDALTVMPGDQLKGLDLAVDASSHDRLTVTTAAAARPDPAAVGDIPDIQLGTIVSMDDPRFTDENGALGLWQPLEFAERRNAGIYFLEAYDPKKIPVLFVHGAGGHPGNFRTLVRRLDRQRFQPWLVSYPSGVRPPTAARFMGRWLNAISARIAASDRAPTFAVVAHSMGGLVARAAINQWMADLAPRPGKLARFITLATPWNGHPSAVYGARAPVVMPAWPDLVPDSDFLRDLFTHPLPPECEYRLLFTYGGGSSLYRQANDGTVTVASELVPSAQHEAKQIYGCDCGHVAILEDDAAAKIVLDALASIPD